MAFAKASSDKSCCASQPFQECSCSFECYRATVLASTLGAALRSDICKRYGVRGDLSPYRVELAVASGSQLPVSPSSGRNSEISRHSAIRQARPGHLDLRPIMCYAE
jgi:hypothetical protein